MLLNHYFTKRSGLFVYFDKLWLTAGLFERGKQQENGGQNKTKCLLLCQQPNHTHNTKSVVELFSSLNQQKFFKKPWTLVLPRSQVTFETIAKPHTKRLNSNWPLEWLRNQNLQPEQWLWDIVDVESPAQSERKSSWELARTERTAVMALIEPLKPYGLMPKHIRVAPEQVSEGYTPSLPIGVYPELQHAQHLCATAAVELA